MTYLCVPLRGKKGGVTLISERHSATITPYRWYLSQNGYAISPQVGFLHRLLTDAQPGQSVDHRNSNRLDNRDENILLCSVAENGRRSKQRSHSKWPYKGVRLGSKNSWQARIRLNGVEIYLGSFLTAEQAARAYDAAALKFFGEFAAPNFREG